MSSSSMLCESLLRNDPAELSVDQLNALEVFVNKGRSLKLVKSPELSTIREILKTHITPKAKESELDAIFDEFAKEWGLAGAAFRTLVTRLVTKGILGGAVVEVLEERGFIPSQSINQFNDDGFPVTQEV